MKFFNSDKSGFLSFVAKRMKALFALFFIIAGTSSVWGQSFYVAGNGNGDGDGSRGNWCDGDSWSPSSSLMTQQGNIYVKQFASLPANDDYQFKIVKDGNWDNGSWGFSNYQSSSDNTNFISGSVSCSNAGGNIKFSLSQTANVTVVFDFTNNRVAVYSSSVEIGLIGSFINNWNLEQQIMGTTGDGVSYTWDLSSSDISLNNSDEFKFISGTSRDNNNNQWGGPLGGAYTIPPSASTDGTIYNVDIVHHKDCGNVKFDVPLCPVTIQKIELNVLTNDLKITTGESSTEPDPVTPTADSYVVTWAEPVYDAEAGTVVLSATVAAAENAGFALADGTFEAQINVAGLASSARTTLSESNQYTISHTISGVAANQQIDYSLQIVTGGGSEIVLPSDVQNINPQAYTVPESVEPGTVSLYLIGSGTSAKWELANALPFTYENGVYTWTGELTVNDEAFKILTSNTEWEPAYVAETNQFEVVLGETIVLHYREKTGDTSTWDDNKFKITEGGEYTIKVTLGADNSGSMIVTKKSDPAYSATITADASVAEQVSLASTLTETAAGTDLATATCVFQYKAADAGDETYADMSEPASVIYNGEGATRTATLSRSMAAGDYVFRAVWTYNSAKVANAVTGTVTIPSDTPTPTDIEFYVRGEKIGCTPSEGGNCWGVASEEFKATSKEGNVYVWNWTSEPKLMVGPFKIADAFFTDENNYGLDKVTEISLSSEGTWRGFLQVNKANGDMIIPEPGWNVSKITFDYDTKELLIETKTSSSCQDLVDGFTISGQFNKGVSDGGGLYEGKAVESGETDPADGYWSDGARFIQLTANSVAADLFEWQCVGYKIDDNAVETENIPTIAWTGQYETSARAELSLPGTYTFVCKATCNGVEAISESLTITAPAPEMGFNGNIVTNHDWGNPEWAGQRDGGYMQRVKDTLVWKSNGFTVDGFGDNGAYHFVIEQRYKLLGCVTNEGWTENGECGGAGKDNKINRSNLSFTNVAFNDNKRGYNFIAINNSGWTPGVNGTKLQLTVTMTGWDSYTVALEEVSQECTTPADNFAISARLNQGSGAPFEGNLVASGSNTATGGYFADDFRTVTLTTTQLADTYEWKLVGYAIDGNAQATAVLSTLATITNGDAQTATALLSVPGDYTFQCTAACTDGPPVNSATVTISTYPEIGFDGPIATPGGWNHAWAGTDGLMNRAQGSLTWSKTFIYQSQEGLSDQNCFVVIQRYKLGCIAEASQGWAGFDECGGIDGNKINKQDVEMSGVHLVDPGNLNYNFVADDVSAWTPGVTELTLTVTMTGWDSYTVELSKKQEQIFAYYSSNNETMGTVTMKVGDTPIAYGADITAYIGQQVTLTASPAPGYKVASWEINGKVTVSDRTTITPTLSGDGLEVVVTFERNCYAGVVYDLTGGGVICAHGGSTELSLNTLIDVTYQLYKDGAECGDPVQGNGKAAKWTISETGTYTAKAYDSRHEECEEQAMDMKGRAVVTSVPAPKITVNPGDNVHLTVLQARSFTADVPVDWSITDVTGSGDYCKDNGYMISSRTDTSLVAKFLCVGTAKITAAMKDPNQNCKAEVTVTQNGAETEVCAPEPEDVQ